MSNIQELEILMNLEIHETTYLKASDTSCSVTRIPGGFMYLWERGNITNGGQALSTHFVELSTIELLLAVEKRKHKLMTGVKDLYICGSCGRNFASEVPNCDSCNSTNIKLCEDK